MRQWVEAIFDTLKDLLSPERHGDRCPAGVFTRIAQRLLALAAGATEAVRDETPPVMRPSASARPLKAARQLRPGAASHLWRENPRIVAHTY